MDRIKVGIIGAAGYTAGELLRLLNYHPGALVSWVQSESQQGNQVSTIHKDLIGDLDLEFIGDIPQDDCDTIFLCKGHGESVRILADNPFLLSKKIIDLSQDYRLAGDHDFVYGLPEFNRTDISSAEKVANPGCFATTIQLGILPAIHAGIVQGDIHISGITGSTGAGQQLSPTSHFSWRNNNVSVYKAFTHQHLNEINQSVCRLIPDFPHELNFIPYRGNFTRGIIVTSYFQSSVHEKELTEIYQRAYLNEPFTLVTDVNPDIKMVVNTNKCLVYPKKNKNNVMVISVLDNLTKGASGQAVQNMNLMHGFEETAGLNLKAVAF